MITTNSIVGLRSGDWNGMAPAINWINDDFLSYNVDLSLKLKNKYSNQENVYILGGEGVFACVL